MKKQAISILLLLSILLGMLSVPIQVQAQEAIASGSCGTEVSWELTENGVLTIRGQGAMTDFRNSGKKRAPWLLKRGRIRSVVIEPGVTSIGDYAFQDCKLLAAVSIPRGVIKIGHDAFRNCEGLSRVYLPNTVKNLG